MAGRGNAEDCGLDGDHGCYGSKLNVKKRIAHALVTATGARHRAE